MGDWKKRDRYLTGIAERLLQGQKTFTLRRVHLVEASGISRGTIYNHFPTEEDLILALCRHRFEQVMSQAEAFAERTEDPLEAFVLHQCWILWDLLNHQRFVLQRLMPNPEILAQASSEQVTLYRTLAERHRDLFEGQVRTLSADRAFDRAPMVCGYVRGSLIQCDDDDCNAQDPALYEQYAYGLIQLLGRSDRRAPSRARLEAELAHWAGLDASARQCA
ncbi:TetR/AcrR family transcriptional regulator [Ferrimonas balearica]|uniref:TetR/AcrR family transcriptional regulator n=1 Tax=Ferrimonas balearica TaxID=44012 RepID=UPI001C998F72|nr:TetR/AcrR family transcriptional regulator [Ferrimonas balearica]MBY5992316.1 TetR/AcrR family transcriptional regulator [Ferrimonas balearica]